MDEQLAAIYGTNTQPEQPDLEKMAAAELLVKLAEEEGVSLDQFNDQQIAEMINDLYKTAGEEKKEEEKKEKESGFEDVKKEHEKKESKEHEKKEEEHAEKVAEADFLGRVMAHAYVQELRGIEKQAADPFEHLGDESEALSGAAGKRGLAKVKHHLGEAGSKIKGLASKGLELAKKHPGKAALIGGGAAAAAGGAAALRHHLKGKEKKSSADESALEALAQQAAFQMAKEAGYVDDQGNFLVDVKPQEKQASALDQAIHTRALQICEEHGIPVEWK